MTPPGWGFIITSPADRRVRAAQTGRRAPVRGWGRLCHHRCELTRGGSMAHYAIFDVTITDLEKYKDCMV